MLPKLFTTLRTYNRALFLKDLAQKTGEKMEQAGQKLQDATKK